MKILVINTGSSSLKFTLVEMETETEIASGQVERLGSKKPNLIYKTTEQKIEKIIAVANHTEALNEVCQVLTSKDIGVLKDLSEVDAIGHRVVHGAEKFTESVIINEEVKAVVKECIPLAPLHNPPNLEGINATEKLFAGTKNVAVFDTAFHQTMTKEAFLYPIPYELYKKFGIRRYGFHGTSHNFVATATAQYLNKNYEDLKLITCHIGNGCSMAAIDKGKVIDTTMGLTPLEGLVMGTRCGDIDPGIIFYLASQGYSIKDIDNILNKQSGLLGICGTSDMRDTLIARQEGNEKADIAFKIFTRKIIKYIGSYFTLLNGADAIIFTGGIGEYSTPTREAILSNLSALGINLDRKKNNDCYGVKSTISTEDSTCKVIVMPTNEELQIAKETVEALKKI